MAELQYAPLGWVRVHPTLVSEPGSPWNSCAVWQHSSTALGPGVIAWGHGTESFTVSPISLTFFRLAVLGSLQFAHDPPPAGGGGSVYEKAPISTPSPQQLEAQYS